jgi:hypothetical protein
VPGGLETGAFVILFRIGRERRRGSGGIGREADGRAAGECACKQDKRPIFHFPSDSWIPDSCEAGAARISAFQTDNHNKKQVVFSQRRKGRKGFQAWRLCVLARNLLVVVSC